MAAPSPSAIPYASAKAGAFLAFCLALLAAMLFFMGKYGRDLRERQQIKIVFTRVNALRADAPVMYDGMQVGHIRSVEIVRADAPLLAKIAPFTRNDLENLPLKDDEAATLALVPDTALDVQIRDRILDRTVVLLTIVIDGAEDSHRFREDDEFKVVGGLMGDSQLEIRTGKGRTLTRADDRVMLGSSGDLYSDFGRSLTQVKDILASMSEIVGGDVGRLAIQGQMKNLDDFTLKVEEAVASIETKLPKMWKSTDGRIDDAEKVMASIVRRAEEFRPKVDEAFQKARDAVNEMRKNATDSITAAESRLAAARRGAKRSILDWHSLIARYKTPVPDEVRKAREASDSFNPFVDKLDAYLTRTDAQLGKSVEGALASFQDTTTLAGSVEEKTFRLRRWPWSYSHPKEDEDPAEKSAIHRRELARRQYVELRAELERFRAGLKPEADADRPRIQRVDEILREMDRTFELPAQKGAR